MLQIIARFSAIIFVAAAVQFSAQGQEQSLEEILEKLDRSPAFMSVEDRARLMVFRTKGDREAMLQRLEGAREKLEATQSIEAALLVEEKAINAQLDAVNEELMTQAGRFGNMLGQFRYAADRVGKQLDRSLVSWEHPGRSDVLKEIASARTLPTHADLMTLPNTIIQEMEAQSEIKRFEADVIFENENDQIEKTELIRIGVFTAVTTRHVAFVGFREVSNKSRKTYELVRYIDQPGEPYRSMMRDLMNAKPGETVRVPIDRFHGLVLQVVGKKSGRL